MDEHATGHRLRCRTCGFEISATRYANLLKTGRDITRSARYRMAYEEQIARHGAIVRKYSLAEPTLIEAAVGVIVSGILGNAAYDAVKSALSRLRSQILKSRPKPRSSRSEDQIRQQDADFVFKLLGSDDQFANTFIGYAREHVARESSSVPSVAQSVEQERTIDALSTALKSVNPIYVYVGNSGRKFHRASCGALKKPRKRLSIKDAVLAGRIACSRCKPLQEI